MTRRSIAIDTIAAIAVLLAIGWFAIRAYDATPEMIVAVKVDAFRQFAAVRTHESTTVTDLDTSERVTLADESGARIVVGGMAWSPRGDVLAVDGRELRLIEPRSGSTLKILEQSNGWMPALTFSPNGDLISATVDFERVSVWSVETGRREWTVPRARDQLGAHTAFGSDGLTLWWTEWDARTRTTEMVGAQSSNGAELIRFDLWHDAGVRSLELVDENKLLVVPSAPSALAQLIDISDPMRPVATDAPSWMLPPQSTRLGRSLISGLGENVGPPMWESSWTFNFIELAVACALWIVWTIVRTIQTDGSQGLARAWDLVVVLSAATALAWFHWTWASGPAYGSGASLFGALALGVIFAFLGGGAGAYVCGRKRVWNSVILSVGAAAIVIVTFGARFGQMSAAV